jgi:hypothetical protein
LLLLLLPSIDLPPAAAAAVARFIDRSTAAAVNRPLSCCRSISLLSINLSAVDRSLCCRSIYHLLLLLLFLSIDLSLTVAAVDRSLCCRSIFHLLLLLLLLLIDLSAVEWSLHCYQPI